MNSFGKIFRINIFGESHGPAIGITIDNCPPGIPLNTDDFKPDIASRKSGDKGTTPRKEDDIPEIISGVFNGFTTGSPLSVLFRNTDTKSSDYNNTIDIPRPGHADFTARVKFNNFSDHRGGGHFSGRLTLPLVAAGVIAKKICKGLNINAYILEIGGQTDIKKAIEEALKNNDSIGGIVECRVTGLPVGLGEPFFDSVESLISHIIFAIPAIKGIEFGSGFASAKMNGSEHNDLFSDTTGKTLSNNAGGVNGGITNGNELVFRVAVKPTSSISKPQSTINLKTGKTEILRAQGRHDTCIALRVPVVLEAVTACVLADLILQQ